MNVRDITVTSLETITAFDPASGAYMFTLDELQSASIAQAQETTDLTGKNGRKLDTLDRNKTVTITGANGVVSNGLLEAQTGGTITTGTAEVMWTDYITIPSTGTVGTAYKAVGTTGAEIEEMYTLNDDGTLGTKMTQVASSDDLADDQFVYTPSTKALTFSAEHVPGEKFVAYYKRNITADVLTNESDKFSKKATLYVDALGEDKCSNIYRLQFYFPKTKVSGEFTFDMGDSQTIHNFSAEALAGNCGLGGALFTYTVFGADAADA